MGMHERSQANDGPRENHAARKRKHHLDKRADALITSSDGQNDDDLLSTPQLADWLGTSTQFLEIARSRGFGPRFLKISSRRIRYRREDVIIWLAERSHAGTAEYMSHPKTAA